MRSGRSRSSPSYPPSSSSSSSGEPTIFLLIRAFDRLLEPAPMEREKAAVAGGGTVGGSVHGGGASLSGVRSITQEDRGKKKMIGSGEETEADLMPAPTATRGGLPKSISIRSRGFLTVKQQPSTGSSGGGEARQPHRLRLPASPALHGGDLENGEGEVEVEVFNQGMSKTELCNKWREMGWCSYEERCRFAHGIEELRPVIRHPRFKTQLCRMLGSGGECPYGHRCHFRHSLPSPTDR